jgi:hypothetical protein
MAVVGNVGTYAQVQPIQGPDFGGMVKAEFDKLDAEKKAKAAAVAKAKADELKDRKDPDAYSASGLTGYDESMSKLYKDFYNSAIENKKLYEQTGDSRYLYEYDKTVNEMNTITNEAKGLADYFKTAEDLAKSGKLNKDNYDEVMSDLQQLRDGKAKYIFKDGRGFVQLYDQDGTEREPQYIGGFVKDNLNLVGDIELNDEYKKVVDRVTAPLKESGSYYSNVKVRDINSPEAQPQREAIQLAADALAGDNAAMTKWYQSEMKPTTKVRKTSNWTDDEKKAASKYFYDNMAKSYGKEVERGYGAPPSNNGGGKGDEKEIIKPTDFRLPGGGKGHAWDASGAKNPRVSSLKVNVYNEKGKPVGTKVVDNLVLLNVYMVKNAQGKEFIKVKYSEPTGTESQTYTKEDVSDIEKQLASLRSNTDAYNEKKNELELAKRSLSGIKTTNRNELVIPREADDQAGNVANALGLSSTDELFDKYRELAGFNKKKPEIKSRITNY